MWWMALALLSTSRAEVVELSPLEVITGEARLKVEREEIAAAIGQTLGDLLEGLPGLHNQSFGPAVGRPVSRGHGGHRLAIFQSGLGLGDASAFSGDHALGLSARDLTEVRVVRGSETLLYGSGLLGGLVLTEEGLLPEKPPPSLLEGVYRFRGVDSRHFLRLRGTATSGQPPFPAWLTLSGSRFGHGDLATGRGRLDHSSGQGWRVGAGLSLLGQVALGYRHLQKHYGVPIEHRPEIELRHHRLQLSAEPLPALEFTFGWTSYHHEEREAGEEVSLWRRGRLEGRLVWRSEKWLMGLQGASDGLEVSGEEASLPRSSSRSLALFLRARWPQWCSWFFRLEHRKLALSSSERHDLLASGGFRAEHAFGPHTLWLDGVTTARAPSPEELYFTGIHHALGGFQEGSPDLRAEQGQQLELGYRFRAQALELEGTLFTQFFEDYIFWKRSGEREGFPLWRATQEDARFLGFEAALSYFASHYTLTLFGDLSRGWLASGDAVPFMPPLRYGLELTIFPFPQATLELKLLRSEPQRRAGKGEEAAPGFLRLDLKGSWRLSLGKGELLLFAAAENLLDQTMLPATAFRKLPAAGRGVQVGFEVRF